VAQPAPPAEILTLATVGLLRATSVTSSATRPTWPSRAAHRPDRRPSRQPIRQRRSSRSARFRRSRPHPRSWAGHHLARQLYPQDRHVVAAARLLSFLL